MLRAGILFFLLLVGIVQLRSQATHGTCGTVDGEWGDMLTERLLRNKQLLADNPLEFRNINYVPVRFHMVANNSGAGRVTYAQVLDVLCALNNDFSGQNLQFYIKGITDNINNTAIHTTQYTAGTAMNLLRDQTAMNVWIVETAVGSPPSPNDPPGTVLGYYSPVRDWIVIRRDQANLAKVTLSHEVGHFFSLRHTHNGWDSQPYNPNTMGSPAPNMSPGNVPTERQDGSNCNTAGDFLCDTPPDYNGLGWPNCNYNLALDPTGTPIDPDETNFMSYFDFCPRNDYNFSTSQQNLMLVDYNTALRNYLRPNVTPNLTEITQLPALTSPINNQFAPGYNAVNFQWTGVNGADFFLLEIDTSPNFSSSPVAVIVPNATSHTVTTLQANRTYYWRVRPYNAYRTCAPFTATAQFRTNNMVVSTNEIADLDSWTVSPNPVAGAGVFQVNLRASKSFDAQFLLYDTSGRLLERYGNRRIDAGASFFEFSSAGLAPGVYILALQHTEGRELRRIVVGG